MARPVSLGESPGPIQLPPGPILRFWLWLPDWVFQAIGVLFFVAYLYGFGVVQKYRAWPQVGPFYSPVMFIDPAGKPVFGEPWYFPWSQIIIDATFLLIILAFVFRVPPRRRADKPSQIVIPLLAAVWPLLPSFALAIARGTRSSLQGSILTALSVGTLSAARFWAAMALMCIGNGLDVWSYSTLFRSLSIVAEARVLKQRGPYRWIRHPIYLGQFLAQAGFYLVLVQLQVKWVVFYLVYVAMQLYRAAVEERVLINAFGEEYQRYRRQAWWFF